jgi:hypothetical protein
MPTKKNLDNLDIGQAIYNVEKRSSFYEPRIKDVPEEIEKKSKQKSKSMPRKVDSSLDIREQGNAFPALASFKAKPLPTFNLGDIEKELNADKRIPVAKLWPNNKEDRDDKDSDDKFTWIGNHGIKTWLVLLAILIVFVASCFFGYSYLKEVHNGSFKTNLNQTINNTNTCNPIVQTQPASCNLSCGTTNINFTLSKDLIDRLNQDEENDSNDTNST